MGDAPRGRGFASDNASGLLPEVLRALEGASVGHAKSYGGDQETRRVERLFETHFGPCRVYCVFNGTGANVLGLKSVLKTHQAVICAESSHLNADECGALECITGSRVIVVPAVNGKIQLDALAVLLDRRGDQHASQPAVVSITQPTELGTVYSLGEIEKLADFVHDHGLLLHVDGARLVNAAAALDVSLKELTVDQGVDVLSFGGTKHGLMCAESVVFFRDQDAEHFEYTRKQGLNLASKSRFLAAQFDAWLSGDLWLKNARHANRMAKRLAKALEGVPNLVIPYAVESNAVFARLPMEAIQSLKEHVDFYTWSARRSEVRWMMNFDTTEEDVDGFAALVRRTLQSPDVPLTGTISG